MTITLHEAVKRAAVIDPETCKPALNVVRNSQTSLVPYDVAQRMVADAQRTRFVNNVLTLDLDGTRYQFPEVVA